MLVGQLPFETHQEDLTASERKHKLIQQINKGIASSHRKALASISCELKTTIGKMLAVDPLKRTSANELVTNRWLTDGGRKFIRNNPYRKLEDERHLLVCPF